jgi:hypothetical protein
VVLLARGVSALPCLPVEVVPVTYDEWWASVLTSHAVSRDGQRLGQRYYNMLPREIADAIVATRFDPFALNYITQELHDKVSKIWRAR